MSFVVCFVGCPFRLICIPSRDRIGWHPIDERQMTIRATHRCTCTWNWTESEPDIGHSSRDSLLHLTAAAVKVRPPDGTDCPFSPFTTIISVRYANFGQFSNDPMRANFFGIFPFFSGVDVRWRRMASVSEWMNESNRFHCTFTTQGIAGSGRVAFSARRTDFSTFSFISLALRRLPSIKNKFISRLCFSPISTPNTPFNSPWFPLSFVFWVQEDWVEFWYANWR